MLITPGSDKIFETDVKSVAGYRMSIVISPNGYYKIKAEGPGQPPKICEEMFTGLKVAQKALTAWAKEHEAVLAKKEMIREVAKRGKSNSE